MVVGLASVVYFALADPQIPLILLAVCLTLTMGWASWQLRRRNPHFVGTLWGGTYGCLMLLMVSQSWVWELNEAFPVVDVGRMIAAHVPSGQTVYSSFEYGRPSLEFYAEHPVGVADNEALRQFRQDGYYLLLEQDALEALQIPPTAVVEMADGFSLVEP